MCVPTPAVPGLNDVPVTPGPLNVPPTGVPAKMIEDPLTQTAGYVHALTTGNAFTVMVVVALALQPFASVYE